MWVRMEVIGWVAAEPSSVDISYKFIRHISYNTSFITFRHYSFEFNTLGNTFRDLWPQREQTIFPSLGNGFQNILQLFIS